MIRNYFKVAIRNFSRNRIFSLINLTGLIIGMACCTIICLILQHEFSYDRHHSNSDRIYKVLTRTKVSGGDLYYRSGTQGPLGPTLQKDFPEVQMATRILSKNMWVSHNDQGFEWRVCLADHNFLDLFTFPLLQGNPSKGLQTPYSVFITQTAAKKLFGSEDPIGKIIKIDHKWITGDFQVSGILRDIPETSSPDLKFDVLTSTVSTNRFLRNFWGFWQPKATIFPFQTYIMLSSGYSSRELESKLPAFTASYLGKEISAFTSYHLQPLTKVHLFSKQDYGIEGMGDIGYCYILAGIGLLILFIACSNFILLSTAHSTTRTKEIGLRKVVGANRLQLIHQFLGETLLLSLSAFLFALVLVEFSLPYVNNFIFKKLTLDTSFLLAFLSAFPLSCAFLAGIYPAFLLSACQPAKVLKGDQNVRLLHSGVGKGMVIFQFAISVSLIIVTLVVYKQLDYMQQKKLGFNKEHIVVLPLFQSERTLKGRYEIVKQVFLQHPNILNATTSLFPPGYENFTDMKQIRTSEQLEIENKFHFLPVDKDFIRTYEIKLIEGHGFSAKPEYLEAVINEAALNHLGWESANDRELIIDMQRWRVVGVMKNFHNRSLHFPISPLVLLLNTNNGSRTPVDYISLRIASNDVSQTIDFLEKSWKHFVSNRPFEFFFLDDNLDEFYRKEQAMFQICSIASALAISVACLGLFGLASLTAKQRKKEVGIRKVFGASGFNIVSYFVKGFLKLLIVAILIAWPVSYYYTDLWLRKFAYKVDVGTGVYLISGFTVLFIFLVTVTSQGLKVALTNPVNTLRDE